MLRFLNAGRLNLWLVLRLWLAGIRKPQQKRTLQPPQLKCHAI
jgi:hypothetical protein